MVKRFVLILLLIVVHKNNYLIAQNPNFNFSMMDFTNWNPMVGKRGICCDTPVVSGNSHTIITNPGSDPIIGATLKRIPEEAGYSIRLGSPGGGAWGNLGYAWKMSYDIQVTSDFPFLYYRLALVGDNTHACNDMAHGLPLNTVFQTKLLNSNGQALIGGTCSEYEIESCSVKPFQMYTGWNTSTYFPWSSVGIDLKSFINNTVTLEFYYYTCYYHGYHGNSYAYLIPDLIAEYDTVYFCTGTDSVMIKGLPDFKGYQWSNGDSTRITYAKQPKDGEIISCTYSSFNDCNMTRKYLLKEIITTANFNYETTRMCNLINFTDKSNTTQGTVVEWRWDFGDSLSGNSNFSSEQNPSHLFSVIGYYNVTLTVVTDSGCTDIIVLPIEVTAVHDGNEIAIVMPDIFCAKDTLIFKDITVAASNRSWILNDSFLTNTSDVLKLYFPSEGNNKLQLTLIGSVGCPDTLTTTFYVNELPDVAIQTIPPTHSMPVSHPEFIFKGLEDEAAKYVWDLGYNNTILEGQYIQFVYPNIVAEYTVLLQTYSKHGCYDTVSQVVKVVHPDFMIPNVFSPNGDGINDYFKIENLSNHIIKEFSIYNRKGQRLYYVAHLDRGWDGTFKGKPAPPDVYFYIIRYSYQGSKEEFVMKGDVTLIK